MGISRSLWILGRELFLLHEFCLEAGVVEGNQVWRKRREEEGSQQQCSECWRMGYWRRGRQRDLRRDFGSRWSLLGGSGPGGPWDQASPARELTHVHAVGLHLPLVLLVHGPHVAVKEAWGVRDLVAASTAEGDGRQWHPCRPGLAP